MRDVNLPWTTSGTVNRRLCLSVCCIIVDHGREIIVTPVRETHDIFAIGARFNLMDNVVPQLAFFSTLTLRDCFTKTSHMLEAFATKMDTMHIRLDVG